MLLFSLYSQLNCSSTVLVILHSVNFDHLAIKKILSKIKYGNMLQMYLYCIIELVR